MENDAVRELAEVAKFQLVNKPCWSVIAGTGSLITLGFGDRIARVKRLKNPTLTEEQRASRPEFELYVCCAWRLESENLVICTSTTSTLNSLQCSPELINLPGRKVVDARIEYPGLDLVILFEGGVRLYVFADQANEIDNNINYHLSTPHSDFTVGLLSKISVVNKT